MSSIILYHQVKSGVDCPDGLSAAWVAKQKYPDAAILGCVYADEPPNVWNYDRVIIVDFSFPRSVIESWMQTKAVVLIDHHKTALEHLGDLSQFSNVVFNLQECGATLAWKTFFPDEAMPAFLRYVRDRDLWNLELEHTEEIHEATAALKRSFALFDVLAEMSTLDLERFLVPLGAKLLKPKRRAIQAAFDRHEWIFFEEPGDPPITHNIPIVRLKPDGSEDRLVSDICSALYKALPSAHK